MQTLHYQIISYHQLIDQELEFWKKANLALSNYFIPSTYRAGPRE